VETATVTIHPDVVLHKVSRYIYGHFAEHLGRCIYRGIWVGEDSKIENDGGLRKDTTAALRKLCLPVLRWPGGCFADCYHWMDGVGPRESRPMRHNLWWDQPESNQFGTDEFMRLCGVIETEPYICLNVGSGSPEEALGWVEYCNSTQDTALTGLRRENGHPEPYGVKFWGIGNENWGCGGRMRPEYYADLYRRFAAFIRRAGGADVKLIACGSNRSLRDWDERFLSRMKDAADLVDYIAIHHYLGHGISDTGFSDGEYVRLIESIGSLDAHLRLASAVADAHGTERHPIGVILDEWGTWYKEATVQSGLYQQNTMQDALFTAACFHLFHGHGKKLFMANMAQTVNVLQALVLTKGPGMVVTPTYHVYEMFMPHRDGMLLHTDVISPELKFSKAAARPAVSASATSAREGSVFLSLVNLDLSRDIETEVRLAGTEMQVKSARRLAAEDIRDHNTFDEPERVRPEEITFDAAGGPLRIALPSKSITTIEFGT